MERNIRSRQSARYAILAVVVLSSTCFFALNKISNNSQIEGNRQLSVHLGDGKCRWQPPNYHPPEGDFHKTLVAGYPSHDKRVTFVHMEALTGLATKDEWDFKYWAMTNEPFIKSNYPHHEGVWGWQKEADQVILVVRNLRRSLVEYHDILWNKHYSRTWNVASEFKKPIDDFLGLRDMYVRDEIHWYGWFIDYWMEGGLMRDLFTHKLTTPKHWNMLTKPSKFKKENIAYEKIVGDIDLPPSYDPHCINDISGGCYPVEIISAERLVQPDTGPAENRKIAQVLANKAGIGDYVIEEEAWDCVWREITVNKKGHKFIDREGFEDRHYNFSEELLKDILIELNRLITKYSSNDWRSKPLAQTLTNLLMAHRNLVSEEMEEVKKGVRELKHDDFLGPETRKRRAKEISEGKLYW